MNTQDEYAPLLVAGETSTEESNTQGVARHAAKITALVVTVAAIAMFCVAYAHPAGELNFFSGAALGQVETTVSTAVSRDFAPLVQATHTGTARVNSANQHIDLEASRETNTNEMRQLQIANDNLQFAQAKT